MARLDIHVYHNDVTGNYIMHSADRCTIPGDKCVKGKVAVGNFKEWSRIAQEWQTMQVLLEQVFTFGEL